jgi:AraC-like DNA-binding protein
LIEQKNGITCTSNSKGAFHLFEQSAFIAHNFQTMRNHSIAPSEDFLQNLNLAIEAHISDPRLRINRLLRMVGMSRTDLHRKLDRTVGMSATQYIRHIRLRRAAELLVKHPDWCVYEVAWEVGFDNQSYFTKKFKEIFGCCPIEWRKHMFA